MKRFAALILLLLCGLLVLSGCEKRKQNDPPATTPATDPPVVYVTLSFVSDGEAVDERVVASGSAGGAAPTYYKKGYELDGWFAADGTEYDPAAALSADAVYTARSHRRTYAVTFVDDEGNELAPAQQVLYEGVAQRPDDPTPPTDKIFDGWTCRGEIYDFENTPVTGNVTLIAAFAPDPVATCDHSRNTNRLSCLESTVCSFCGKNIPATGHHWLIAGHTDGTCEEEGKYLYVCSHCDGERSIDDGLPLAAHVFENGACVHCGVSALYTASAQDPDTLPMPDRYNTGAGAPVGPYADHTLTRVTDSGMWSGVPIIRSVASNGDVTYRINTDALSGAGKSEIVLCDLDFSDGYFRMPQGIKNYTFVENFENDPTGGRFCFRFVNCLFDTVGGNGSGGYNGSAYNTCCRFEYCSLVQIGSSNVILDHCRFGGNDDRDATNPMQNFFVFHSYVTDKESIGYERELHTDAIQIYGYGPNESTIVAKNIHYYNFRAEMPSVYYTGSQSYTNSILMISLDYNNAENISFEHCYINGCGCPIMINDHPHAADADKGGKYGSGMGRYRMTDVVYRDIIHGCANQYSNIISSDVVNQFTGVLKSDTTSEVVMEDWNKAADALYVGSVWYKDGKLYVSATNETNIGRELTVVTPDGARTFVIERCPLYIEFEDDRTYREFPFDVLCEIECDEPDWVVCFDTSAVPRQVRCLHFADPTAPVSVDLSLLAAAEPPAVPAELAHGHFGSRVFYDVTADGVMHIYGAGAIPDQSENELIATSYYAVRDRITRVIIDPDVTSVGAYLFKDMFALTSVSLPSTITKIGTHAFEGCTSLTDVRIPYGVTSVGAYAFADCISLTDITVPSTVGASAGAGAFSGCTGLRSAAFLGTVMQGRMFENCENLETILLSGSLRRIADMAFYNCPALREVRYTGTAATAAEISIGAAGNCALPGSARMPRIESMTYVDEAVAVELEDRGLADREPKTPTHNWTKYETWRMQYANSRGVYGRAVASFAIGICPSKVYDGQPFAPDFATDSDGEITYKWLRGGVVLDGAPVDAGRYVVVIYVSGTENYKPLEFHQTVYIRQASASLSITTGSLDKDFDGLPVGAPAYTSNSTATPEIKWYFGEALCDGAPYMPGSYRVVVTMPDNGNYTSVSRELSFEIRLPAGVSAWDGTAASAFDGGAGSESDPWQIRTAEQLARLAALVNDPATHDAYASACYVLTGDIHLNLGVSAYAAWYTTAPARAWTSVGCGAAVGFSGHFDGRGHVIYGLYAKTPSGTDPYAAALFGCLTGGAVVENLRISFANIVSEYTNVYASFVAAYADEATVRGVTVTDAALNAYNNAGGIVGLIDMSIGETTVEDCSVTATITGRGSNPFYLAGIVGYAKENYKSTKFPLTIRGCVTHGSIKTRKDGAGIVNARANMILSIENCVNYMDITTTRDGNIAGIVTGIYTSAGGYGITLRDCVNFGDLYAVGSIAGGLISSASLKACTLTVENCANYGAVKADGGKAGGLIGNLAGDSGATSRIILCNVFSTVAGENPTGNFALIGGGEVTHSNLTCENVGYPAGELVTYEGTPAGTVAVNFAAPMSYLEALNRCADDNGLTRWEEGGRGLRLVGDVVILTASLDKYEDGLPVALPAYAVRVGDGEVGILFYQNGVLLPGAPAAPGDYRVIVALAATDAASGAQAVLDFCISVEGSATLSIAALDKVYDGSPVADPAIRTTNEGAAVTYEWYRGEIGAGVKLDAAPTDAGRYYVTVSVAAVGDHAAISKTKAFVISKAPGSITGVTNPGRAYNGEPLSIGTPVSPGTEPVTVEWYRGSYAAPGEKLSGAPTDVGSYALVLSTPEQANYLAALVYFDVTITRIPSAITVSGTPARATDGTPASVPAYEHTQSGGTITVTWTTASGEVLAEAPSAPGSYKLILSLSQSGNYAGCTVEIPFDLWELGLVWNGGLAASFVRGTGLYDDPFVIETPEQLALLASLVNAGRRYAVEGGRAVDGSDYMYAEACYRMDADLYFNENSENYAAWSVFAPLRTDWTGTPPARVWTSIGTASLPFGGVFDGNGHKIIGLYTMGGNDSTGSLFGQLIGATVENLTVTRSSLNGNFASNGQNARVGGIASFANLSTLDNCRVTDVTIHSTGRAGGLLGSACNKSQDPLIIRNCTVDAEICSGFNATQIVNVNAGGLIGNLAVHSACLVVENCAVSGTIRSKGNAAGLVNCGTANPMLWITGYANRASVTSTAGEASGCISAFYSTSSSAINLLQGVANYGAVTGATYAGGLLSTRTNATSAGTGYFTFYGCANYGAVTCTAASDPDGIGLGAAGGLVGYATSQNAICFAGCVSDCTLSGLHRGQVVGFLFDKSVTENGQWAGSLVLYAGAEGDGFGAGSYAPKGTYTAVAAADLASADNAAVLKARCDADIGKDHRYSTTIYTFGEVEWSVSDGRLIPAMVQPEN